MDQRLIYDIGLHRGEDSDFYLKKGFRVVGVEANAELCAEVTERFRAEITSGQFTVVNKAIAREPGRLKFYRNTGVSVWGTVNAEWADRNRRYGAESVECEVDATTMAAIIDEFGAPYYIKIDIEGNDLLALEGLGAVSCRPKYVSIESDKDSFRGLRREISTMRSLGYEYFKIVEQRRAVLLPPPRPSKEGKDIDYRFVEGCSGVFGEDLVGPWLNAEEVIESYRPIFLRYALTGDDPFVRNRIARRMLRNLGFEASWYDTHARLS